MSAKIPEKKEYIRYEDTTQKRVGGQQTYIYQLKCKVNASQHLNNKVHYHKHSPLLVYLLDNI